MEFVVKQHGLTIIQWHLCCTLYYFYRLIIVVFIFYQASFCEGIETKQFTKKYFRYNFKQTFFTVLYNFN